MRRCLCRDSVELARWAGFGVRVFVRFERGQEEPPLKLLQLLRRLEREPELLKEFDAK
jgi:HTH-type transcriptional regulator / antitoxin MqsA